MEELLAQGFWHHVIGLLSTPGRASLDNIIKLASKEPFSYNLLRPDALRILNLAKLSRVSAVEWFSGRLLAANSTPSVRLPAVPNIQGGNPGETQVSLLVGPVGSMRKPANVVFSSNGLPSVEEALKRVAEWMQKYCATDTDIKVKELCDELSDVELNWLGGRKDIIVPSWIITGANTE